MSSGPGIACFLYFAHFIFIVSFQLIYLTVHRTYRRLLGRWEVVRVNWESAKEWMRLCCHLGLLGLRFLLGEGISSRVEVVWRNDRSEWRACYWAPWTPLTRSGFGRLGRYSPTTSVGLFLAMCDPELGALDWTYTGVHASSYPLPIDWRLPTATDLFLSG